MNISALRRTQLSIMDITQPFNMNCWYGCIAGHALTANGDFADFLCIRTRAQYILGLTDAEAKDLFYVSNDREILDRAFAVRKIDALIAAGDQSLRGTGSSVASTQTAEDSIEITITEREPELVGV